ncbi:hypothetical protein PFISCL1PPCAC_19641 [Pristionchus fissidentatus]|uniref:Protein kinase domain-containing protein n=1 Tax=Pristionchus fissidentatus TaxID=1538716 RepID=A0AAV5WEW1_9BILA|nr:hypothetical protein PFISCL1PPCAC_19641 [Pristionchus fissidentatus]
MAGPNGDDQTPSSKPPEDDKDSESDGDGAEEILEESPCRRWSKRREQVKQRDVPGIDFAYLAMDNETGNEVVWNEVQFSERKNFKVQEAKINAVFDNLTHLVHPNLVKFHKWWTDTKSDKPRIIFITEYMSSGSMFLFLQRTRKSGSNLSVKASEFTPPSKSNNPPTWKKWTTQILSALNYLHSSSPPIIHGNLTSNTVFIQQNGLIKIGSVAPDAINHHVKTCRDNLRYLHYMAPECNCQPDITPATDIYAFGIVALEIATCGAICPNGSDSGIVTIEAINKAVEALEDSSQKSLIASCIRTNPEERPSARQLLFHRVLFEVHSLKLLAAHVIVDSKKYDDFSENIFRIADTEKVVATSKLKELAPCQVPNFQLDLEKFLDDVRNGIYPLTAFAPLVHPPKVREGKGNSGHHSEASSSHHKGESRERCESEERGGEGGEGKNSLTSRERSPSPSNGHHTETIDNVEPRSVLQMKAVVEQGQLTLLLQLDDCMNRQLTTEIVDQDNAQSLVHNLVNNGFISESDSDKLICLLEGVLSSSLTRDQSQSSLVLSSNESSLSIAPPPLSDSAP